jgi:long-chain fatty acid transport protein
MSRIDSKVRRMPTGLPRSIAAALIVASSFVATSAWAGGLYVNEYSTSSQANGGAGRGAYVPDASASLHNPASMTRLDDHGFASGMSLAVGNIHFDTDSTPGTGGTSNGGNQAGVAPIASLHYVHKISDRFRFGFNFFSISGSVLNPSDDWGGRFQVTDLSLLTISMSPTLAVRVTDWLSVGGGPVATYGVLNWDLKVPIPAGSESNLRLDDLDDWQASARVGLLFHPRDDFSLSVKYQSKTDFELDGKINGPIGIGSSFELDLPLAQFVEVSAYWQVNEKVALLALFNWEDWSEADHLRVVVAGNTVGATTGFMDTYKFGLGANYQLNPEWLLQTGVTYDTSALKNTDRTVALPIDEQIRVAIGAQHDWSEALTLGFSFVYINLGQGEVRSASVRGDYQENHIFVFGLNLAFDKLPWSSKPYVRDRG